MTLNGAKPLSVRPRFRSFLLPSFHASICASVCVSMCASVCASIRLSCVHPYVRPFVRLCIRLSFRASARSSIYPSACLPVHLYIHSSVHLVNTLSTAISHLLIAIVVSRSSLFFACYTYPSIPCGTYPLSQVSATGGAHNNNGRRTSHAIKNFAPKIQTAFLPLLSVPLKLCFHQASDSIFKKLVPYKVGRFPADSMVNVAVHNFFTYIKLS